MVTPFRTKPGTRARRWSRFGYDHHWWGEPARLEVDDCSYWSQTRRPLPCLVFILPILAAYELGVVWLGGPSADAVRTGADAWMRHGLASLGLTDQWLLPLALVAGLLGWQASERRDWRFGPACLAGMAIESLILAVALIGLSRVVDLGFTHLEGETVLAAPAAATPSLSASTTASATSATPGASLVSSPDPPPASTSAAATSAARSPAASGSAPMSESRALAGSLVGFLGAGVYEEALFRLALIPVFFGVLRVLQTPRVLAQALAVTGSALLFSIAHHAGTPGETFTWFAFIFRWLAGVFFAWVFVVRGFGVAVGTHTAYDILVGWLGWHF